MEIVVTGPLFDGRAHGATAQFIEEAEYAVAAQGLANLHLYMDQYFRNPTPYYETQVMLQRVGDDMVVHDRGIVYGPWLSGESSRNQVSRFKGYPHWKRATQDLERQVPRVLQPIIDRFVAKVNG